MAVRAAYAFFILSNGEQLLSRDCVFIQEELAAEKARTGEAGVNREILERRLGELEEALAGSRRETAAEQKRAVHLSQQHVSMPRCHFSMDRIMLLSDVPLYHILGLHRIEFSDSRHICIRARLHAHSGDLWLLESLNP
jgi:hypothetical protein